MAFGYALLKGRGGAAGYARESGGKREIYARGLPPEASCALYTFRDGEYRLNGTETADSGGNAKWTAPQTGQLFIAAEDRVLLWDGGDEAFLQASAWLREQKKRSMEKDQPETEEFPEAKLEAKEKPAQKHAQNAEVSSAHPSAAGKTQTEESPPERAYTLRPAGTGEPVDTLPER